MDRPRRPTTSTVDENSHSAPVPSHPIPFTHTAPCQGLSASCPPSTQDELEACIRTEYPKVRVGIHGGRDVWASGVLDIGVCPVTLIDILRRRFEAAGGIVLENTAFRSATVHSDGVLVRTRAVSRARGGEGERGGAGRAGREIRARVVLDCMGHYSPIVRQMRGGAKPEGIVMVVGGCHEGIPAERNVSGDLLCTIADSHNDLQMVSSVAVRVVATFFLLSLLSLSRIL